MVVVGVLPVLNCEWCRLEPVKVGVRAKAPDAKKEKAKDASQRLI